MKLTPYPTYKVSGVEWMGKIPEEWKVNPLKHHFKIVGGSTPKSDQEEYWDGDITWVTPSDLSKLSSFAINNSQRKITSAGLSSCGSSLVPAGSIVLSTRAPIGSLALAEIELCTNQGCKSLVPNIEANSMFYTYLLSVSSVELNARGKGTTFLELSGNELSAFKVGFPSPEEQSWIVSFLDRETGKLDTLIAKQEHLIELLQEKRQAIITHAVTKGLDPYAKMKDSGVEWLGKIPDKWFTAPLKKVLFKPLMYGANEASDEAIPENPRYVRITDIDVDGNLRDDTFRSLSKELADPYLLSDGDILLARSGATVGKSFIYKDSWGVCCFAGYLIKASVDKSIMDADFLYACFQSTFYWQYINSEQIQATIQNVSAERYGNFKIPVPTIEDQFKIILFLKQQTAKIDSLIDKSRRSIELAKEHRTALISAAVTGKIDVREAA